nr:integrase, catalytic region, zinc finger, CCHC-type, peptidase aspartic, catalytic [Tanacetum cinerariifolium]
VILVSSASESMSQDNTNKNRIRRTQSKANKNKVEDHLRTVKSSLNKKSVVDSKATSSVLNSVLNVNSDLKFASLGNVRLLTRIATPTIVPPREPIPIVNSLDKPAVTLVYTKKPKASNKKVPNKLEPNNSWGSSSSNVPSSLLTCRLSKSSSGYRDYQIGNVTISRVYYVEGLGHNLFSVGKFCDSDLEADIGIFIGYAPTKKSFRIYNRRTRRIVETIHVDFDELTAMASEQSSSGPDLNDMTPGTISSGLVRTSSSSTSYVPPSRNDWDLLFQLIAPSLTTVDQDAPLPSKSLTPIEIQSLVILQDVGNDNLDMEVAHMGNDPLLGVPIPEVTSDQSSSTASPQSNVQPNHPMTHHNSKWTKDHPLNNIIDQLSRPVSIR